MLLLKQRHVYKSSYKNEEFTVLKSENGGRNNYLFVNRRDNRLVKLINTTRTKEKIIVDYKPESDILAEKISIDHKNINLKIELTFIK